MSYIQEYDNGSNDSSSDTEESVDSRLSSRSFCKWLGRRRGGGDKEEGKSRALVIDGGTLTLVLNPVLKPLFLDVARRCVSVICSRATPIQKVSLHVQCMQNYSIMYKYDNCMFVIYMYMYIHVQVCPCTSCF